MVLSIGRGSVVPELIGEDTDRADGKKVAPLRGGQPLKTIETVHQSAEEGWQALDEPGHHARQPTSPIVGRGNE